MEDHSAILKADSSSPNRTTAYFAYISGSQGTLALFKFLIDTAISDDYRSTIAQKVLEGEDYSHIRYPEDMLRNEPGPRILKLRQNAQLLLELFVVKLVDGFQSYVVDILREILQLHPKILSNKELSLSLEYVLQFNQIEDLRNDIVDQKVNDLSYKGFGKLKEWCKARGVPLEVNEQEELQLVELISVRNIVTHNRSRIDKKYLTAVPDSPFSLGDSRSIDVDYLFNAQRLLDQVVATTDTKLQLKFSLPVHQELQDNSDQA